MDNNSFYKVGIKLLTDKQLENVFPDYPALLEKIELYREKSKCLPEGYSDHIQYNLMFDNVFSIMGKRGTGKTSVAFTLKKKIEEGKYGACDVVLPLIIPEVIPNDCSVLVWILAIVKTQVKLLEEKLNELTKGQHKNNYWTNCHYEHPNAMPLDKQVENLMELVFAGKYNPSGESSFYKAVGNSVRQAGDYYRFSCEIADFWNAWIEKIKQVNRLEKHGDCSPLLFFIFDDVDLEPQKVAELLSIIMKYLSHPNIIVITTADEEMFLEVIENNLDRGIGRLPKEWRVYLNKMQRTSFWDEDPDEPRENDLITQTARMYLGKVLPTSTRYYLRLFNRTAEKAKFRVDDTHILLTTMYEQTNNLLALNATSSPHKKPLRNFLKSKFYLNFMGDTSRQIGNAYLGFNELMKNLTEIVRRASLEETDRSILLDQIYNSCRYFLYIEINANHELAEVIKHTDEFVDEIFWRELHGSNIYINYYFLYNFLNKTISERTDIIKENFINVALALFSLLIMLENILLILEPKIKGGVTGRKEIQGISDMVNFINEHVFNGKSLFRTGMEAQSFFEHYSDLLDRLVYCFADTDQNDAYFYKEYLYSFINIPFEVNDYGMPALQHMLHNNREWLREVTGILAMVYGNIFLIEKSDIDICWLYTSDHLKSAYQSYIDDFLYTSLLQSMGTTHIFTDIEKYISILKSDSTLKNTFDFTEKIAEEVNLNFKETNDLSNYVPLKDFLDKMIKKYENQISPNYIISYINYAYDSGINSQKDVPIILEDITNILQWTKHSIERTDYRVKHMCIPEPQFWVAKAQTIFTGNANADELLDRMVADYESRLTPDTSNVLYLNTAYYKELRARLEEEYESSKFTNKTDTDITLSSMIDLFATVDAVICLGDREELRQAVDLGFKVLIMMELQGIYFYQSVMKKKGSGHWLSSLGVDMQESDMESGASRKGTFYYNLYQTICRIITDNHLPAAAPLKAFLIQSINREINKYFSKLIRGITNE